MQLPANRVWLDIRGEFQYTSVIKNKFISYEVTIWQTLKAVTVRGRNSRLSVGQTYPAGCRMPWPKVGQNSVSTRLYRICSTPNSSEAPMVAPKSRAWIS